jgi:hypothetical protein
MGSRLFTHSCGGASLAVVGVGAARIAATVHMPNTNKPRMACSFRFYGLADVYDRHTGNADL